MPEVVNNANYREDPYMDQLEGQIVHKPQKEHFTDSLVFFVVFFLVVIILGVVLGIYGALYFSSK